MVTIPIFSIQFEHDFSGVRNSVAAAECRALVAPGLWFTYIGLTVRAERFLN
jgi:hypothetical protein